MLGIVLICAEEKYELKTDYENCVESQGESNCEGSGINIMNKLVKDIYTRFGVILRSKYMCGS